jgi:hypothetical protein
METPILISCTCQSTTTDVITFVYRIKLTRGFCIWYSLQFVSHFFSSDPLNSKLGKAMSRCGCRSSDKTILPRKVNPDSLTIQPEPSYFKHGSSHSSCSVLQIRCITSSASLQLLGGRLWIFGKPTHNNQVLASNGIWARGGGLGGARTSTPNRSSSRCPHLHGTVRTYIQRDGHYQNVTVSAVCTAKCNCECCLYSRM